MRGSKRVGKPAKWIGLIVALTVIASSCSVNRFAVRAAGRALAGDGGSDVFLSDNDPDLVGDALPFILKLYDALLAQDPDNEDLLLAAGSGYISYANAFLQGPAEMLDISEFERSEHLNRRAKNLYLRGRDMVLAALELRRPGFAAALQQPNNPLTLARRDEVPHLYWAAAGWMGAYSVEPFDLEFGFTVNRAGRLMARALQLQPDYQDGAIYEFYISYYGGLPEVAGGSTTLAREYFQRAVAATNGQSAGAYVALATTVSVAEQNIDEFRALLAAALEVDVDQRPSARLVNVLSQRRARWLLEHEDDFFLLFGDEWDEESDLDEEYP